MPDHDKPPNPDAPHPGYEDRRRMRELAHQDFTSGILRYFEYEHLKPPLAAVSSWFHALAYDIERDLPPGPERSTALRKLLEAKDAAVRAALDLPADPPPIDTGQHLDPDGPE
jgi:hypothetical protein